MSNFTPAVEFAIAVATFLASVSVGLVVHELGHFLAAGLVGMRVEKIVIGGGPILLHRQFGITSFEFHLFPSRGFVRLLPILIPRRYANIFFVSGGVLANGFLIWVLGFLVSFETFREIPSALITAIYFGQAIHLLALIPGPSKTPGISGTDGAQLIRLLFSKQDNISRSGALYLQMARRYVSEVGIEILESPVASYILYLFTKSENETNEATLKQRNDELQRMLGTGVLSNVEELLILDSLLTTALLNCDPLLLARTDEWSLRALTLAPRARPLLATRGGVLAELGRWDEAKALLEPMVANATERYEQLMCRLFLAYAEWGLGNEKEVFRCLWQLRRTTGEIKVSRGVLARLAEIETKVSKTWPLS